MFIIDEPYVSDFLKQTLQKHKIPVIKTAYAESVLQKYSINFVSEGQAIQAYEHNPELQFFTNSENALDWIFKNFPSSSLATKIRNVKDKVCFRDHIAEMHPQYYYQGCPYSELETINPADLPYPIILKPSVGFFSLGVQRIDSPDQWAAALADMDDMTRGFAGIYPSGVLNNSVFVIEAIIPGDEFAVDCYFDEAGEVVILNMMKHMFASGDDVNDRVYITSSKIVQQYLSPIENYLNSLGSVFKLTNFQAHIEIRIHDDEIAAIEINPLRFGGWCSTADLAQYAWGLNLYDVLVNKVKPDWGQLIKRDRSRTYALIVLNNSTGTPGNLIQRFDYEGLLENFSKPLELRKTDFHKFPLFGFLMCSVADGEMGELEFILHSDLKAFISENHLG